MKLRSISLGILVCFASTLTQAESLLVATAAGYRKPMTEVYTAFKDKTGITVESAFGNMKQIEAQAKQNPDIQFLVGDWFFIEKMGLASTHRQIGQGKLIMVSPKANPVASLDELNSEKIKHIAIADRSNAIYGKAAIECFEHNKITDQIQSKLIEVPTLPQVSTYVKTAEVEVGFVNLTEAMAHSDDFANPVLMADECYRPITLSAVPLQNRSNTDEAQAFLTFLASDQAKEILKRHGL